MVRARRPGSPRGAAGHGDRVACPRGGASHRTRPPQSAWRGMPVRSPCVLALNHVPLVPVLWNPRAFVSRHPVAGINAQRYPNPLRQSLRRRGSPTRFVRGERQDLSPAHTVSVVGPTALCVGGDLCRCRPSRAGRLHRRLSRKGLFADSGRARAQAELTQLSLAFFFLDWTCTARPQAVAAGMASTTGTARARLLWVAGRCAVLLLPCPPAAGWCVGRKLLP